MSIEAILWKPSGMEINELNVEQSKSDIFDVQIVLLTHIELPYKTGHVVMLVILR